MNLSHWTTRCDEVTFVSLLVENPHAEAARFRVESRLDGPVWPPRRNGRPEQGWDSKGYEGSVEAKSDLVLGYATSAPPAEPVATIEWAEPGSDSSGRSGPEQAARNYADPRPPRDVLSPVEPGVIQPGGAGNQSPDSGGSA